METISIRLKAVMTEQNLRQADVLRLAEPYCARFDVKLSKSDLSQFLSDKGNPGRKKLLVLSEALQVSEAWLSGYDVPKNRLNSEEIELYNKLSEILHQLSQEGQEEVLSYAKDMLGLYGIESEDNKPN